MNLYELEQMKPPKCLFKLYWKTGKDSSDMELHWAQRSNFLKQSQECCDGSGVKIHQNKNLNHFVHKYLQNQTEIQWLNIQHIHKTSKTWQGDPSHIQTSPFACLDVFFSNSVLREMSTNKTGRMSRHLLVLFFNALLGQDVCVFVTTYKEHNNISPSLFFCTYPYLWGNPTGLIHMNLVNILCFPLGTFFLSVDVCFALRPLAGVWR